MELIGYLVFETWEKYWFSHRTKKRKHASRTRRTASRLLPARSPSGPGSGRERHPVVAEARDLSGVISLAEVLLEVADSGTDIHRMATIEYRQPHGARRTTKQDLLFARAIFGRGGEF
jgi:hypothetical protein